MTTLSTHDTKRGEDVRARLAVLSEMPRAVGARAPRAARATPPPATDPSTACSGRRSIGAWPTSPRAPARVRREGRARGRRGDDLVGSGCRLRGARACDRRCGLRRPCGRTASSTTSSPRSRPPDGRTRSRPSCSSSPAPAFPTSTRAPSCGRHRSSTPTTADPSTSTSDGGCCGLDAGIARGDLPAVDADGRREAAGHLPGSAPAARPPRPVHPVHADDRRRRSSRSRGRVRSRRRGARSRRGCRSVSRPRRLGRHDAAAPQRPDDRRPHRSALRGIDDPLGELLATTPSRCWRRRGAAA